MKNSLTISELEERALKPNGGTFSRATINRWITHGLYGQKLPALRCGLRYYILLEDWNRFYATVVLRLSYGN